MEALVDIKFAHDLGLSPGEDDQAKIVTLPGGYGALPLYHLDALARDDTFNERWREQQLETAR